MALHLRCEIIVVSCLSCQEEMRDKSVRSNNGGQGVAAAGPAEDRVQFSKWEEFVWDMNPEIIGAGIRLGPGMAEGGAFKKQRDAITFHVALKHKLALSIQDFEECNKTLLNRRLKLTMSQLQFTEQV